MGGHSLRKPSEKKQVLSKRDVNKSNIRTELLSYGNSGSYENIHSAGPAHINKKSEEDEIFNNDFYNFHSPNNMVVFFGV